MKPYLQDLINKHKDSKHKIRTAMFIFYDRPECNQIMYAYEVQTNIEEINLNDDAAVITNLFNFLMDDYKKKIMYGFKCKFIDSISYYIHKK